MKLIIEATSVELAEFVNKLQFHTEDPIIKSLMENGYTVSETISDLPTIKPLNN